MSPVQTSSLMDYPSSDGKSMADNTEQARWILTLYANLDSLFADQPRVFVAADNLWYPVEGDLQIRAAPDVYVVFGRPKGPRGSYQQWNEGNTPLTVVFEILSPSNHLDEMTAKHHFYEDHGVEEYYVYDPEADHLTIWTRGPHGAAFVRRNPKTFISPRLGIRFDTSGKELIVRYPDGRPFRMLAEAEADNARLAAERDQMASELDETKQRLRRVRDLGRLARAAQATPEQLAELQRLEDEVNGA